MNIVRTPSFQLASISRGDKDAERVALLLPGRLDTKDYVTFPSHAEYLAARGFFAVAFDPPGTWESPGGIELFTTTNYLKAVNELVEHFGNRPTLLMGHSRGGAVAILASGNPAVMGIVSVMGSFGAPTAPTKEVSYRDLPPGASRTEEQKEFSLPLSYWEDGEQYDTVKALRACTKPKLLVYGTRDEGVEPSMVKDIYESIPEPKMLKELDTTHDYRYFPEAIHETERALGELLEMYLPGR